MHFTTEADAATEDGNSLRFLPKAFLPRFFDRAITKHTRGSGSDLIDSALSRLEGEKKYWWEEAPEHTRSSWGEFIDRGIFHFGEVMPRFYPHDPEKARLVAATVVYVLHLGVEFRSVAQHIGTLVFDETCQKAVRAFSNDQGLTEIQQFLEGIEAHRRVADTFFYYSEHILKLANSLQLHEDPEIQAALFTGLLSYLLDRRTLVISRAGQFDLTEHLQLSTVLSIPSPRLSRTAMQFGLTELAHPGPEEVALAHQAAEACKTFIGQGIIPTSQGQESRLHPSLIPSEEERIRATELFREHLHTLLVEPYQAMHEGMQSLHPKGFPGHDIRHILYVVPLMALMLAEHFEDPYISSWGIFCALLHDVGRIVEPVYPYASEERQKISKAHALMSSAFAAHILDKIPELPESVRFEILATIARHDQGDLCDSKLAQFTQSVDRLQLIGPESIVRNMGYFVGAQNTPIFPEQAEDQKNLLLVIHRYLHRLYPNLLGTCARLEHELMVECYTFLRIAMDNTGQKSSRFDEHGFSIYRHPELPRAISSRGYQEAVAAYRKFYAQQCRKAQLNTSILDLPLLASLDFNPGDETNAAKNLNNRLEEAAQHVSFRVAMDYISEVAWRREKMHQGYLSTLHTSSDQTKATLGRLITSALKSSLT